MAAEVRVAVHRRRSPRYLWQPTPVVAEYLFRRAPENKRG